MTVRIRVLISLAAIFFAGCAPALKTEPVIGVMPPGIERTYNAGDELRLLTNDGDERVLTVVSVGDEFLEILSKNGCRGTFNLIGFAPAVKTEGCPDNVERTTVRNGSIFPMTFGAREEWTITAKRGTKKIGPYKRTCTVNETARITVAAGTFDTYVVECTDRFESSTLYFAPSVGYVVLTRQTRKQNNKFTSFEVSKFTPGA